MVLFKRVSKVERWIAVIKMNSYQSQTANGSRQRLFYMVVARTNIFKDNLAYTILDNIEYEHPK